MVLHLYFFRLAPLLRCWKVGLLSHRLYLAVCVHTSLILAFCYLIASPLVKLTLPQVENHRLFLILFFLSPSVHFVVAERIVGCFYLLFVHCFRVDEEQLASKPSKEAWP